ncbi:MAG TPA: hypothetical protein VFV99_22765, partial [Kofleriaceae bacterium]|nr:hypothetical protein [Kofleriaceae bacterium]
MAARIPGPVHVTEPVRVKIATTVRELVALGDGASPAAAALQAEVARKVAEALARIAPSSSNEVESREGAGAVGADSDEPDAMLPALDDAAAPWLALRLWWRSRAIVDVLTRMDDRAIAFLEDLLFPPDVVAHSLRESAPPPASASDRRALIAIARAAASQIAFGDNTQAAAARTRIAIAAAIAESAPTATPRTIHAAIADVIEQLAPSQPETERTGRTAVHRRPNGMVEVRSVLPFLLLPSLHHAGWLASARTLLAAHDVEDDAFALAAGIAARVLDPLDRGWARSRADRLVIATFAGRDESLEDREIAAASTRLAPLLPALDAGLRAVLVRARRPRPL